MKEQGGFKLSHIFFIALSFISLFFFSGVLMSQEGKEKDLNIEKKGEAIFYNDWYVRDFHNRYGDYKIISVFSKEKSKRLLDGSFVDYNRAKAIIENMEDNIKKWKEDFETQFPPNYKYPWIKEDKRRLLEYKIRVYKLNEKGKALAFVFDGIRKLESIKNKEVLKDPKLRALKIKLYKLYVSLQYDLGNLFLAYPVALRLESLYRESKDISKEDKITLYRYLVNIYAFLENYYSNVPNIVSRMDKIAYYKNKKFKVLLKIAELEYGKDSPEYRKVFEEVQKSEKILKVVKTEG